MENGQRSPDILDDPPLDAVNAWEEAERRGLHVGETCRLLEKGGWEYWGPDPSTGAEWYAPPRRPVSAVDEEVIQQSILGNPARKSTKGTIMTEYYDKQLWAQHDAAVRTAVVVDGKVTESFVWQPGGNIKDYDGPDPNNCQTVEDLLKHGYKRRR